MVLITGASGFIGSRLVQILADFGYSVVGVLRPGTPNISRLQETEKIRLIECSMGDYRTLPKLLGEKADTVFHLAKYGSMDDLRAQLEYIEYTMSLIDVLPDLGCRKFIATGSQAEYGNISDMNENARELPVTPYGVAKLAVNRLSREACSQRAIAWQWARIYSVYGPNDRQNSMVSQVITKLMNSESVEIHRGETMWNFLYVDDAARALIAMMESGVDGEIYNISHPVSKRIKEYVEVIRGVVNQTVAVSYGTENGLQLLPGGLKLYEATGWKPKTEFAQGIEETVRWWRRQKNAM